LRDAIDLVRALYRAVNGGDLEALGSLYDANCRVEHVFDDDTVVGRDDVLARWRRELSAFEGALAGGDRFAVSRVAGIETGWGWVRAEWASAVRPAGGGDVIDAVGHSHFWVEDARIVRHRSVRRPERPNRPRREPRNRSATAGRQYPSHPVVGVGAVIVDDERRVVLVKRTREPLAGQWSLPGGRLELGETLEAGTAREILEETGLVVEVGPVVEVFDRILVDEDARVRFHFVLVDYLCHPRGGRLEAGSDVAAVRWAEPASLAALGVADKARDVVARAIAMASADPQIR
jgi:ADP-ribose pyrophosphatase YjhB (NUDIX family)